MKNKRALIQWLLLPIVFIVIGLGWRYPYLGFVVPVVMMVGIITAFFNGRYACGNLCPRGAFFDRLMSRLSFKKPIPAGIRKMPFRWALVLFLFAFMGFQVSKNPLSLQHWGHVFWLMCAVTTLVGIILGILIHPRTWCAFCPIGTTSRAIGGDKKPLRIDSANCTQCKLCEKKCPFDLKIIANIQGDIISNPDCFKCYECSNHCPKKALLTKWLNS